MDAARKPNPYYADTIITCDDVAIFDAPNMFNVDFDYWRFTADDYVIIGGKVAWKIEWMLGSGPYDPKVPPFRYSLKYALPESKGKYQAELHSILASNGFTFP